MGTANGAMSFDGSTSLIRLPNGGPYTHPGTAFTAAAWIKTTDTDQQNCILSTENAWEGWRFGYTTGGKPYYSIGSSSTQANHQEGGIGAKAVNDGAWHHLAITYVYTTHWVLTAYIDGTFSGLVNVSANVGPDVSNDITPLIGTMNGGSTGWVDGSLADVRVYNRALSASEIANLYNSYNSQINLYSPPGSGSGVNLTAGLVGYWPFSGNAKDATPYQNNGTVNGATLTTDRFGRPNSAYSLNGASDSISLTAAAMPSSAITVVAWVYMPAITPGHSFTRFLSNNWVFASGSWLLYINNTGAAPFAQFGITNPGTTQNNSKCATGSFTAGSWHFLVGTYDGSTVRLYQDGAVCPVTAPTSGAVLNTTGTVGIAANAGTGADPYSISQVRIYNRALSAAEVQALYNLPD